ncbi:hypothetical protein [Nocardioides pocheonensis]|uniref:Uncharacterized protein n=1 Tax=Nocardioides pocheonensis TaxID=661485 RepID=A0A3N0GPA4_9ACTN|nr:hypothetical protein [Nocardioides pocheonensis]RNM14257.1 hypothetical protein EFL26_15165 [Nocardioides pocheonensis]
MKKFGRAGSTFGTVVAAAVVIAVASTGGAVAGGLITSKQIKNNTIKSIDVRDGNLTGTDIADGSVKGADVGDGSLATADLADGAVTNGKLASSSVNAAKLANGAVTASKLGTVVTRTNSTSIGNGAGGFAQVSCLAGETAIGGGATTSGVGIAAGWTMIRSSKLTNGWDAAAWNTTGSSGSLIVEVYCLQ